MYFVYRSSIYLIMQKDVQVLRKWILNLPIWLNPVARDSTLIYEMQMRCGKKIAIVYTKSNRMAQLPRTFHAKF